MSLRDLNVRMLDIAGGQVELHDAVLGLYQAILECHTEGIVDPSRDPAVMLFGAHIGFLTHSDVLTLGGYSEMLEACADRERTPKVMQ